MKKCLSRLLCFWLMAVMLLSHSPRGAAYETGQPFSPDLSGLIKDPENRRYMQMMVDYAVRNDPAVGKTLEEGYSAVFLFEGCSDNMAHPDLSDISYYRVSAVCLAVRLDARGEPYLAYFNQDCSTLPDRPLEYGAWELEDVGEVGPATVCDGTYELYSIKHGGAYEALHVRTSEEDDKVSAVYMTPEGFVTARADQINIHTRNVNHTIQGAMWSAGCILVGAGDFGVFTELMESTYYATYDTFRTGRRVGTLTIDRQCLKEKLYELYEDTDAVDMLLAASRRTRPETYLNRCRAEETFPESKSLWTTKDVELMSLPCSNATDARSVPLAALTDGEKVEVVGSVVNPLGNLWYEVSWEGRRCYLFSGYAEEPGWFSRVIRRFFL